jgi:tRNA nucleotidyltransferase (CCA-adding enzyme)
MARAGHVYPQVEPGVEAMMNRRVVGVAPGVPVTRALRRARAAGAAIVVLGGRSAVRAAELATAADWGFGARPARDMAWRDLPTVGRRATEVAVRRCLLAGASLVLVQGARGIVGAVDAHRCPVLPVESSVLPQLERGGDRQAEARLWLLRVAGKVGEGLGSPAYAVGGFVRDLLLGAAPPDVDLVVEGDGVPFARRLAEEIGGTLLVHGSFGTASIEGGHAAAGAGPDGVALGRVDIASARRERYAAAGALPDVEPAGLVEDLRRRDFSVNALAVALAPDRFGRLIDPLGGLPDVRARRLRALRPLAFVEDPTRIVRAARYAARLGLGVDTATRAGIRTGVAWGPYPALSGQRLWRELELVAAEPRARPAFELLVRWRAPRLWNAEVLSEGSLRAADRFARWARDAGVAVDPAELFLIALLIGRPPAAVEGALDRLALSGEPRARIEAGALAGPLARRLDGARLRPSEVDEALAATPETAALAAWLCGGPRARRRIEWYLASGRAVRPRLRGADLLALGVPRGPRVGEALGMLRRRRLDGDLGSLAEERDLVKEWLTSGKEA